MNIMDMELFISEIQARSAIWDTKSDSYSNRGEKIKAWEEICELFVENFSNKTSKEKTNDVSKLQRKWKSLRDSFNRENAKNNKIVSGSTASSSKQYIYFNQLSFLNGLKEVRPSTDIASDVDTNAEISRPQVIIKKRRFDKPENETFKQLPENRKRMYETLENENDPDKHFLLSLLPHVKKIDDHCKLDFQSEVLQLLKKYTQNRNYHAYPTQCCGFSSGNANEYSTKDSTSSLHPTTIIQASPSHSYDSDQSMDNSSIIEYKFQDDNE